MDATKRHEAGGWQPQDRALAAGFALWQSGQQDQALQFFQQILASDDQNAEAWQGLGSVAWSLKRFEQAEAAFQQAVRWSCWEAVHWANLGLAFRELRRWEQAANVFRVAVSLEPDYAPAYNEWANVLFDTGRLEEALVLYDQSLELDDSRAVVHHNRGVCCRFLGDLRGALLSFSNALRHDPGYAYTLQELQRLQVEPGSLL